MTDLDFSELEKLAKIGSLERDARLDMIWVSKGKCLCSMCKYGKTLNPFDLLINSTGFPCFEYVYRNYQKIRTFEVGREDYVVTECDKFEPINQKVLYQHWIKSDRWKTISKGTIKKSGYKCQLCGSAMNLAVHHITYEHIGCEDSYPDDLLVVCSKCHKDLHEKDIKDKERLSESV